MNSSHMETILPPKDSALLELTYHCNFNCPFCYVPWIDHPQIIKDELSTQGWKNVIDSLASVGINSFTLSGGEPLTRPDLPEIIEHIKKQPALKSCTLYTNLALMNRSILSMINDTRFEVCTSLQGIKTRPQMTGYRRSLWQFKRSCRAIALSDATLSFGITITKTNIYEAEDIIRLADALGAVVIQIGTIQIEGRAKKHPELWLTFDDIQNLKKRIEYVRDQIRAKLIFVDELHCSCRPDSILPEGTPPDYHEPPCSINHDLIVVGPDGRQRRCVHTWDIGEPILPS